MAQEIDLGPASPSRPSPFDSATGGSQLFRKGFVPPAIDDRFPKVSAPSFELTDVHESHESHEQSNWKAWFDAALPDNRLPLNEPPSAGSTTPIIKVTGSHQPYTPDAQAQPQDSQNTPAAALDAQYAFSRATMAGQYSSHAYPYSLEMENGGEEGLALAMADEDEDPTSLPIGPTTETVSPADTQFPTRPISPTCTSAMSQAPYTYFNAPLVERDNSLFDQSRPQAIFEIAEVRIAPNIEPPTGIASPIVDDQSLSRPISPSNMTTTQLFAKKRSFSEMAQAPPPPPPMQMQFDHAEHRSSQPEMYETCFEESMEVAQGHKVQRPIKRGDPPQAHDGKYYCNFAPECAGEYFDRKCEWRQAFFTHRIKLFLSLN